MSSSSTPPKVAARLARALVAGPWRLDDLIARGASAMGRKPRWLSPLLKRLLAATGTARRPSSGRVAAIVLYDDGFSRASTRGDIHIGNRTGDLAAEPAVMWPGTGAPSSWGVPAITTPGELAERLGLSLSRLRWMADPHARERRSPGRYAYRWVPKRSGQARLLEVPGERLRMAQRQVLREILDVVPAHDAAHGFRRGRSIRTYAEPHVGRLVVLKMDLLDFFPTVTVARVKAIFLTLGYPEAVAVLLAGLCTNCVPSRVWEAANAPPGNEQTWRNRRLLQRPHLPQGSPSSPAIANLAAYRLDVRLSGLAEAAGASYTRYADDLAFSGDRVFARSVERFHVHACAVALEEGFTAHTRKTRVMRRGVRQKVAGVVVNDRPNVARNDFDTLKAILHNCSRNGPGSQNREGHPDFRAHLLGRIAHVQSLNPDRGERLRRSFDRIVW